MQLSGISEPFDIIYLINAATVRQLTVSDYCTRSVGGLEGEYWHNTNTRGTMTDTRH